VEDTFSPSRSKLRLLKWNCPTAPNFDCLSVWDRWF
jgi:hypothetical protein